LKLKEIKNLDLVETFIKDDPELWERVSEDGNKKEDFRIVYNPMFWWIGCYNKKGIIVGVFWMHHINNTTIQVHAHVRKEYRLDYAFECGKNMIKYFLNEFKMYDKMIAEIPEIYKDVIHFTLKFGFKEEGINRLSYKKDNKVINQHRFGITRKEASKWLQQQQ